MRLARICSFFKGHLWKLFEIFSENVMEELSGLHLLLPGGNHIIYRFFQWLMFLSLIDILLTCVSVRTFLCILLLLFSLYFLLYFCLGLQNEKFSILCVIVNLFNILWIILYDTFFAGFLSNFPKVNNTSNFHQGRAYLFSHQ